MRSHEMPGVLYRDMYNNNWFDSICYYIIMT